MILDFFLFPVFLCCVYTLGAGVLRIFQMKERAAYPTWFYFTTALFTVGFISVLFNFFTGVASPLLYLIIFIIAAVGTCNLDMKAMYRFIVLGIILAPFAANMPPGPDAALYHLPHQLWIHDEKIIFGLANVNTRFGFSSFLEYLFTPLWIGDQFKLLSYTQATFFVILLLFLSRMAHSSVAQIAAAGVLTLAALIINSKYFVVGFTSTDTPCGIFFAITFFYGLMLLSKDTAVKNRYLTIFFLCALFTFFSKASGAIIFLWVFFVIGYHIYRKHLAFNILARGAILPAILMLIWLARGVIVSGCVVYPIAATCLDVPWAATHAAIDNANAVTAWARQEGAGLQPLQDWSWIHWWWHKWSWFCLYEAATVIISAALYRYLCKEKMIAPRNITLPVVLFALLSLTIWFLKSPATRFGIGVFIILPAAVAMGIYGVRRLPPLKIKKLDKLCHWLEPQTMVSTLGSILVILLAIKLVMVDAAGGRGRTYLRFTMIPADAALTGDKTNNATEEKYGYKYFHE